MADIRRPKQDDERTRSATGAEKSRLDDRAVENTLTAGEDATESGTKSVLPGPPIPPGRQTEIRSRQGEKTDAKGGHETMIDAAKIREHMEVVGSDGKHVGTVDRCENQERIKLTRSDPAAQGKHRFIPLGWVDHVDKRVHLARTGEEVLGQLD
jgi:hypothetical protein